MRGLYFGIVALPLVAAALVFRRDRLTAALAWGSLFALLTALGGSLFVRTAMHVWMFSDRVAGPVIAESRWRG